MQNIFAADPPSLDGRECKGGCVSWEKVTSKEELHKKGRVLFKKKPKQIVVFERKDGVYAIDNRCPHQGYPLNEGAVEEKDGKQILTCHWHNWKFDLAGGACVSGGDPVRSYPIKIEKDFVWVDLQDPSQEEVLKSSLESFDAAFVSNKMGRVSRELVRLHFNKIDPRIFVKRAIELSHVKLKKGMTHAYAATADWLTLYEINRSDIENQLICLLEAIEFMSEEVLRHKDSPFSVQAMSYSSEVFLNAIENENNFDAESFVLGALEKGLHFKDLEGDLTTAALAHYNDFGHSLIYVNKAGKLIEELGERVEKPLLLSLVRSLCFTTREDLLPEFQKYQETLKLVIPGSPMPDIFQKPVNASLEWVVSQLDKHAPQEVFDALLQANAKNLLYFNSYFEEATDTPLSQHVGWLDFTHALTFAHAVKLQCEKFPQMWKRALLQLACFNGRNHSFLDLEQDVSQWWVKDEKQFFHHVEQKLLDHGLESSVLVAHYLKTYCAVKEMLPDLSDETKKYILAGLNRFLNSRYKHKHSRRKIKKALELIGKDFNH